MNFLYVNYPKWIKPQIFPGVPVLDLIRWYGLMYVFAFVTAFIVLRKEQREGLLDSPDKKATEDDLFSFIACGIIFLLVGARVFSTLVYDTSGLYLKKPWLIFWPFQNGKFTGLAGMSYHGGFIGGLIGMIVWCLVKKRPVWKWIDAMSVAIPLGYTFGRIGNFLNGELYGRITTAPWGMVFPAAERFPTSEEWVREFAAKVNMTIFEGQKYINLPRHPSQLYEALFEGVLLFVLLWNLRNHKPFDGFMGALYTIGYGTVRFVIEYFRQPDSDIGYRITKDGGESIYTVTSLLNISTGQILCFIMILGGIGIIVARSIMTHHSKKTNPKE